MIDRRLHGWTITLGRIDNGAQVEREIHNYWDPDRIETPDAIGAAAAAEAFLETRVKHVPVAVVRL